ncbi:MAG: glutathionylspermidine synthase family protein [Deltaproteobacteria bacterium]|nr:glutathionylspermidine synthase family protein [Deltaproteobacteria bacterium]
MMDAGYAHLADALLRSGVIGDPWVEGAPRFATQPVVITPQDERRFHDVARALCTAFDAVGRLCAADPALVDERLALTRTQALVWRASHPHWHGLARADLFTTSDGLRACELNCDTPTGEAEAVLLNRLLLPAHPGTRDPNAGLEEAFTAMVEGYARAVLAPGALPGTAAILYPTEITEDLSLVRLYRGWLQARGWRVLLGSPFNLQPGAHGSVEVFGQRVDLVLRHYKTDGWTERTPAWDNEPPFADPEPLVGALGLLLQATLDGKCAVVNPFGSVLAQNKRTMALLWEELARLPAAAQDVVRAHLPLTVRLETLAVAQLLEERMRWVLKSDYGAEGAEVVSGAHVTEPEWRAAVAHAIPRRWVAQERFTPLVDARGESINMGVFVAAGEPCGLYARLQAGPTDGTARSAAVLVQEDA